MRVVENLPRPLSPGLGNSADSESVDGTHRFDDGYDAQAVRRCLLRMEQELQRQRADRTNFERFLVDEVCQDLAGISYLLAAVQSPRKPRYDVDPSLRRISELLSMTLSRCVRFAANPVASPAAERRMADCPGHADLAQTIDIDIIIEGAGDIES